MANDAAKKLDELVGKRRRPCQECARTERERRYGTESSNQYDPPKVQVLPLPPPFIPPDFDGMYKRTTTYPARFADAANALRRARSQVQLYEELRAAYENRTTGSGGLVARGQATADDMEQQLDSILPGQRIYQDNRINRETLVNAYNHVMAEAGLTPEPTAGVTKSVLIDRMLDAGVKPGDLRDVILNAYQPYEPSAETSTRTPTRAPTTSAHTPPSTERSTSTRTQPPPTPPPDL